ncbi:hypothetical protein cypCar_00009077 [Cyprinus carpio]|nr:hypothetical protein cypCar_00009077 [Cyprinus carpio]
MAGDRDGKLDNQAQNEHVVRQPFLIGVAGGTASGKVGILLYLTYKYYQLSKSTYVFNYNPVFFQSSVCGKIMELLGQNKIDHHQRQVVILSQDSFYRVLTPEQKAKALKGQFNFDHPDAFDNEKEETVTVYPADVVLFEGILMFYSQEIRDLFQMKLFVDTDADTRLSRRVLRDISERGRDLEQVLSQYITFVKPAFEEFCLPTKKYADVIIPRGADNLVAINLIVQHIQDILNGGLTKRLNGYLNGHNTPRKRHPSESSSRPH